MEGAEAPELSTTCVTWGSGFKTDSAVAVSGGASKWRRRFLVEFQFFPQRLSAASSRNVAGWLRVVSSVCASCRCAAFAVSIWVIVRVGLRGVVAVWLALVSSVLGVASGVGVSLRPSVQPPGGRSSARVLFPCLAPPAL